MSYIMPNQVWSMELTGKDENGEKTVIAGNVSMVSMSSDGWGGVGMELRFVPDSDSQVYSISRGTRVSKHYTQGAYA